MHWMLMPLRRYAEFSGRSRRKEYWLYFLFLIILYIILASAITAVVVSSLGSLEAEADSATTLALMENFCPVFIIAGLVWLGLIIPNIAVGVRRLHDINRSGWWILMGYGPWLLSVLVANTIFAIVSVICNFATIVGFLILLILACFKGTVGPNRFGPDPKATDQSEIFA